MSRSRVALLAPTIVYLALIGGMTLGPQPLDDSNNGVLMSALDFFAGRPATAWITYSLVEFLANIAMFVPLGCLLLALLGRRRWWLAVALGVATTLVIEFTQQFLPTRYPDVRDLVANSLGTLLGVAIVLTITGIASVRRERAAVR